MDQCPNCGSIAFGHGFIDGSGPSGSTALRREIRCAGCGLYWTPEEIHAADPEIAPDATEID